MAVAEIHVNDSGTRLRAHFKDDNSRVDITGAYIKDIIIERPNGTKVTKDATIQAASSGIIYIDSWPDLFNEPGTYRIQGEVAFGSGRWKSSIETFPVYENL